MNQSSPCAPCAMPGQMTRGDTAQFTLTVRKNGAVQNLTGASLQFVAQGFEPHRRCRISHSTTDGGIVVAAPLTGVAVLTVSPADTLQGFPNEEVRLETMWVLTDSAGNVTTVSRGVELTVLPTLLQE